MGSAAYLLMQGLPHLWRSRSASRLVRGLAGSPALSWTFFTGKSAPSFPPYGVFVEAVLGVFPVEGDINVASAGGGGPILRRPSRANQLMLEQIPSPWLGLPDR